MIRIDCMLSVRCSLSISEFCATVHLKMSGSVSNALSETEGEEYDKEGFSQTSPNLKAHSLKGYMVLL